MSTVIRPSGPLPPGVYWVRRLLALLVVVALVLGARWVWQRTFGSSGTPEAGPSTSPTAGPTGSASSTPSTSASTTPSKTATPSATKSPSASSTAVPLCADDDIVVTASTDAASYPVGSTPRLRMRIQNTSSTPCRRDIGAAQNELLITSGDARVWSSDDCNPGGSQQVQTIQPGQSYSVTVTWLGKLSKKGCPADQPEAQAGSYKLTGRNSDVTSKPASFSLTKAA